MKNKILFLLIIFLNFSAWLFAMGSNEDIETDIQKDEWLLCITNFDSSSLPENKEVIANTIMRKLVESLNTINYRTRVSPEFAYYEAAAWAKSRTAAAKALADKQNERSLLLYRGDSGWRYRRNIEKIDNEIEKLRVVFEEVEDNVPFVDSEPLFDLTKNNLEFEFPDSPKAGNEYKFCIEQKSDALLTGSIVEFHERFIVSWRLYTIYTRTYVLEDTIIFSHDDLEKAMEEIMRRLIIVLSGNEPAVLTVKAEPEDTLVLINRSFAGRGETSDMDYPPGIIIVTASAPNYESLTFEAELSPEEYTDIDIKLWPVEYGDMEILSSGSVYNGALYIGEAPLTLRLPVSQMNYIELKSGDNARSTIAFQTPEESDFYNSISVRTQILPAKGRVDNARRMFYWAWGGTWLAGITTWLTYQTFLGSSDVINNRPGAYNENFSSFNNKMYNITIGSLVSLGVTAVFDILFLSRYIYVANKGSVPALKPGNIK